ncbi:hypothetical protein BSLG_002436 [Batrachochytrium salamandrivorans]|nr:hypothetical protein BSLG_002436 [Batrachochytrium salamandrivorans]
MMRVEGAVSRGLFLRIGHSLASRTSQAVIVGIPNYSPAITRAVPWYTHISSMSTKVPSPPSSIVSKYWDDVMMSSHEPESYVLGHPDETSSADGKLGTASSHGQHEDKAIRKLVLGVVKAKREQGDIWPSLLTRQCCEFYESLDRPSRAKFLHLLAKDFCIDLQETAIAVKQFEDSMSMTDRSILRSSSRLREALTPAYDTLFAHINQLPGGMRFLSILEAEGTSVHLRALNDSLKTRLQEWFGMGFLDLERITWSTPALILEKAIQYEAVHSIESWQALKQRLGPGRLFYSFFHRGISHEPLTFVQVALVSEIATQVQGILTDNCPEIKDPKVAVFYSISSSQKGLSGVDLGNFLIKRVVKEVQINHPSITTFCTLSPIPGFMLWLQTTVNGEIVNASHENGELLLLSEEVDLLQKEMAPPNPYSGITEWLDDQEKTMILRPIVERLCSRYLLLERKRLFALDPVANFHLRNGAAVHQLNWGADSSEKGIKQSFGMMVNYIYNLGDVESNNQQYLLDGIIAVSNDPIHHSLVWANAQMKHSAG